MFTVPYGVLPVGVLDVVVGGVEVVLVDVGGLVVGVLLVEEVGGGEDVVVVVDVLQLPRTKLIASIATKVPRNSFLILHSLTNYGKFVFN
jgi:hypothetical protein